MSEENSSKTYLIIIRKLIAYFEENNLQPGDKLPPEDELASKLYFGRPALREALRVLELLGVIDSTRGRSNIYVKDQSKGLLHFITIFANLYDDGYTGLSQLRANIEVIGVESFIQNATDIDIMELELTARKFLNERDDMILSCTDDSYHIQFHQLLIKYSASKFEKEFVTLSICAQFLSDVLKDINANTIDPDLLLKYRQGRSHQAIIEAIKAKDVAAAKKIVKNHVMYYSDLKAVVDSIG